MKKTRGFTLIEMSIVLVVIALILGAVSVGSSLIRNAEIQSIIGENARYIAALKSFQDKYGLLPGDFSNASGIFNGATNGNGDGLISGLEQFYAWQHLASAKLVDGSFTGTDVSGGGSYDRSPGVNIPVSQLSNAGWGLVYAATTSSDLLYVSGDSIPGHVLWLGGASTTGNDNKQNPALTSEEADQIDHKSDDGIPGTGKIVAQDNSGTDCHSSTSAYDLSTSGYICSLVFKTGF